MPAAAAAATERMLEALAEGGGTAVVPLDAELTTQQAADILGVSRPTLIKYLDDGTLPFRTIGVAADCGRPSFCYNRVCENP